MVRLRGVNEKISAFVPIWSSVDDMILSSDKMVCAKSLAGPANWERGCLTSIFSERCTNAPVDRRLGIQKALNFPRSAWAMSIPLSTILRFWLPLCSNCNVSSRLSYCCEVSRMEGRFCARATLLYKSIPTATINTTGTFFFFIHPLRFRFMSPHNRRGGKFAQET